MGNFARLYFKSMPSRITWRCDYNTPVKNMFSVITELVCTYKMWNHHVATRSSEAKGMKFINFTTIIKVCSNCATVCKIRGRLFKLNIRYGEAH